MFCILLFSYSAGFVFVHDEGRYLGFGLYGAIILLHMSMQLIFASANRIRDRRVLSKPLDRYPWVGIQISCFQEDPTYLRLCLESLRDLDYPRHRLKLMLCIDGNTDNDLYMKDIFKEVFPEGSVVVWEHNFHTCPPLDPKIPELERLVEENYATCCLQKWNGKREVMFTALRVYSDLDYYFVTDSDTIFERGALLCLTKIIESDPRIGAVGGCVAILNSGDSFVTFLSSLRYSMAFNIERAAQSWFDCVNCISGPVGLYRATFVDAILHLWADQEFLGSKCTFGDDRHLTNRILQLGYKTRYCAEARCDTETPALYLRWLNQQIRWNKSFHREFLFGLTLFHKHSLWLGYESILSCLYSWLIMGTCLWTLFSANGWEIVELLVIIQAMGFLKGCVGWLAMRDWRLIFMSLYSTLYISSLLPAKVYSLITIKKKKWGTSGRSVIKANYEGIIPVLCWGILWALGIIYTCVADEAIRIGEDWTYYAYVSTGLGLYALYWTAFWLLYRLLVRGSLVTKEEYEQRSLPLEVENPLEEAKKN